MDLFIICAACVGGFIWAAIFVSVAKILAKEIKTNQRH